MFSFILAKVFFSGIIIAFASWLSVKKPVLAGFIIALPLMSLSQLFFLILEHKDFEKTVMFSKSILVGVPVINIFYSFFFCKILVLSFFTTYILGLVFLVFGFLLHNS